MLSPSATAFNVLLLPAAFTNPARESVSDQEVAVFYKWCEGPSSELKSQALLP